MIGTENRSRRTSNVERCAFHISRCTFYAFIMAERFEDLRAWKTARKLTNEIYEVASRGAFVDDWALKDQIRRASISVMSNIAEGFESRTRSRFINFQGTAKASAGEVRSQLVIAHDRVPE